MKFFYQGYWSDGPAERLVNPLALKEFKNRWYLIVKDLNDGEKIKSFALDRILSLDVTRKKVYKAQPFDVQEHYKHCFGIMSPNEAAPSEIILSFEVHQGKYIKSLPLHASQEILDDNDKELRIKLTLFITEDLVIELLSFGEKVKVIQPLRLVHEVGEAHRRAIVTLNNISR